MLFTELQKIREGDVHARLEEQLRERGLDPALLSQELGDGVTVEQLLSDVIGQLLTEAADANRESFRARQRIGLRLARAEGRTVGRPSRRTDEAFARVRAMYEEKEISGAEAARQLGIARGTFYRWLKETTENTGGGGGYKSLYLYEIMSFTCHKVAKTGRALSAGFCF